MVYTSRQYMLWQLNQWSQFGCLQPCIPYDVIAYNSVAVWLSDQWIDIWQYHTPPLSAFKISNPYKYSLLSSELPVLPVFNKFYGFTSFEYHCQCSIFHTCITPWPTTVEHIAITRGQAEEAKAIKQQSTEDLLLAGELQPGQVQFPPLVILLSSREEETIQALLPISTLQEN